MIVLTRLLAVALLVTLCESRAGSAQTSDQIAAKAEQGAAAMNEGRFVDAATIYEQLVVVRPGDAGLLMNLGMARYMSGRAAEAVEPLAKAVRLQPSLAPASLFLGAALLDLGREKEATAPLLRAVTAMPGNADAREMLARSYLESSRFTQAVEQYQSLTALQPQNPKGWYGLARSYESMGQDALTWLHDHVPDSPLLELVVADVAVTQEKYAAALAIYRRVMEGSPPVGGLHQAVAELYERAGKPDWAAIELRKVRPHSPAECARLAAECAFLAGRNKEALAGGLRSATATGRYWVIRAANRLATEAVARLETLPPSVELHLIRAELAQSRGRNPEAVAEVRAALALSPGSFVIETALAEALLRAHDLDEGIALLERLTRDHPQDASLLFMYGDALVEDHQLERAIAVLEKATSAPGSPTSAHGSLGRAYAEAGRYAEALPHLKAGVADDPDGSLHYQLARAYQTLGQPVEAERAMAEYQKRKQRAASNTASATGEGTLTPPK